MHWKERRLMILMNWLYYLYKKSPKKLRQLKQLRNLYEESTFSEGDYWPKKASGIFFKHKKILQHQFDSVCYNNNFLSKVEIFSFFKY